MPEIFGFVALAGAGVLFAAHAISSVLKGLSYGDDAYVALAAKGLVNGLGYGLPNSSEEFVPFHFHLTTGPPMILPLAAAIAVLGPRDRLPGAVALVLFALQIGVIGFLLARRFGVARTAVALATLLLLLTVGAHKLWLYGVFMGEAITLGFIVLTALALALTTGRRGAVFAGACAGLAVLTKLLAVFSIAALVLVWFYLLWRARSGDGGWRGRVVVFMMAAAAPVVAFEAVKLVALGWDGYVANWISVFQFSGWLGVVPASVVDLPALVLRMVEAWYIALPVAAVVVAGFALLFRWRGSESDPPRDFSRICVLLIGAAAGQWLYLLSRFSIHGRYLFFAVGLLLVMAALTVLMMERRARVIAVVVVAAAALLLDPNALFRTREPIEADVHGERLAVIRLLDGSPHVPYAAGDWWASVHSVVFARPNAGTWTWGLDAYRLVGQRIFVIVDRRFERPNDFLTAAAAHCSLATPAAVRLLAYDCDRPFWDAFLRPASVLPQAPEFIVGRPLTAGGDCNIDYFGRDRPGPRPRAVAGTIVPLNGWAADVANGLPPLQVALVLRDGSEAQLFATLQGEERADLGAHFGVPALSASGFKAGLDLTGVSPGDYRLEVLFSTRDGVLACDSRMTLTVEPPA